MGLDITFYTDKPVKDIDTFNMYEVRHLAVNFALASTHNPNLSFDTFFTKLHSNWWILANKDNPSFYVNDYREILFETGITHNLGTMAKKAGIYQVLWRIEETEVKTAKDMLPILIKGLAKLVENPTYYKQYDSPNGWGTYKDFIPFVNEIINACQSYPNAIVVTDR